MSKPTDRTRRHVKASAKSGQNAKSPAEILREQMLEILGFDREVATIEERKKVYEESWKKQMGRVLSKYDRESMKNRAVGVTPDNLDRHINRYRKNQAMKEELYSLKKLIMDTGYLLNIDVEDLLGTYRVIRKRVDEWGLPVAKKKDAKTLEIERLEKENEELKKTIENLSKSANSAAQPVICLPDRSGETRMPVPQLTQQPTTSAPSITATATPAQQPAQPQVSAQPTVVQPAPHYTPILPLPRYSQMAAQQIGQIILDSLRGEEHYFFDDVDRKYPGVYNLSGWILENKNGDFNQRLFDSDILGLRGLLKKIDKCQYNERFSTKEYKKKWINFHEEPGVVEMTQAIANLYGIEDGQDVDVMFSYKSLFTTKPDKVSGKARIVKDRAMVGNEWRWDAISLDANDTIASIIKKYMPPLGDFRLSSFYIEKR